ncbi:MAG: hypothetical protein IPK83_07435 [Planctomycetes bacterium]|nr:hypothetical protein [Planctomycetota bacterium]
MGLRVWLFILLVLIGLGFLFYDARITALLYAPLIVYLFVEKQLSLSKLRRMKSRLRTRTNADIHFEVSLVARRYDLSDSDVERVWRGIARFYAVEPAKFRSTDLLASDLAELGEDPEHNVYNLLPDIPRGGSAAKDQWESSGGEFDFGRLVGFIIARERECGELIFPRKPARRTKGGHSEYVIQTALSVGRPASRGGRPRQALDHGHRSACSTNFARSGLRCTYRITVNRWMSC